MRAAGLDRSADGERTYDRKVCGGERTCIVWGGRCAGCSINSVSCSAWYSWCLVPLPFRLHGSAIMFPQSARPATTRLQELISDHYRQGLLWFRIRQRLVRLRICRKRRWFALGKACNGTLAVRFLLR